MIVPPFIIINNFMYLQIYTGNTTPVRLSIALKKGFQEGLVPLLKPAGQV
jgi:hypothetical protein